MGWFVRNYVKDGEERMGAGKERRAGYPHPNEQRERPSALHKRAAFAVINK